MKSRAQKPGSCAVVRLDQTVVIALSLAGIAPIAMWPASRRPTGAAQPCYQCILGKPHS